MSGKKFQTAEDLVGTVLDGRWRLLARCTSSLPGRMYSAQNPAGEGRVDVRFLTDRAAVHPSELARLDRELRKLGRLAHDGIVKVMAFGVHEGQPYLVTATPTGESLAQHLRSANISAERVVTLATHLLETIAYLHAHGITHRGLGVDNVFVGEDKLIVGPPRLMAVSATTPTPGAEADLLDVGRILRDLCAGHAGRTTPVAADNSLTLEQALARMVARSTGKSLSERFASATDFLAALQPLTSPGAARKGVKGARPDQPRRSARTDAVSTGGSDETSRWHRLTRPTLAVAGALLTVAIAAIIIRAARTPLLDRAAVTPAVEIQGDTEGVVLRQKSASAAAVRPDPPVAQKVAPVPAPVPSAPPASPKQPAPPKPAAVAVPAPAPSPLPPKPVAVAEEKTLATLASLEDERREIWRLFDAQDLETAKAQTARLIFAHPKLGWPHIAFAEYFYRRLWRRDVLKHWEQALALDPTLRDDGRFRARLCTALGEKWQAAGLDRSLRLLGPSAAATIAACAGHGADSKTIASTLQRLAL